MTSLCPNVSDAKCVSNSESQCNIGGIYRSPRTTNSQIYFMSQMNSLMYQTLSRTGFVSTFTDRQ
jgi:hypothetical protein